MCQDTRQSALRYLTKVLHVSQSATVPENMTAKSILVAVRCNQTKLDSFDKWCLRKILHHQMEIWYKKQP